MKLKLIQPGKPTQNAFIESFNGKFRTNASMSTGSVRWPKRESASRPGADYNEHRPHSAIGNLTRQNLLQVGELASSS
ncbi:integrase core domain-containing protein [Pseudomonas aeruginosa]|uniref:integrase core domain-containing protein n=1 Tax=Pseudomonas aeruginosa TaxID=287 RepID=UPI003D767492